ncbi:MAG: DUF1570 domain-containing protein [Planctomycetota bacterium]|nr:DUF1570 domain-containing protein [Planctomycetota bacterium]
MPSLLLLAFSLLLFFPTSASAANDKEIEADTILLSTGKSKTGRVVYEDDEVVILRNRSKTKEYERGDIDEVNSRVRNLDELLTRIDSQGPDIMANGDALAELAQFAAASRLSGESEALFLAALLANPEQAVALEALGCRERKGSWQYKKGSKWIRTSDLALAVENWKDRWKLRSVHYKVESNQPLGQAIKSLLDLERFYRTFFEIFQEELHLLEPEESMDFMLHGDNGSYPETTGGRKGWFDSSDLLTHVNASSKPWRDTMFHEATHHMFHMTTVRAKGSKGSIPAWTDEGMAEMLATGLGGEAGFVTFDIAAPDAKHFRTQTMADKPHDLSRTLNFKADDYRSSVGPALKYAQSYTLVWFVMYGNNGERFPAFMNFMRSAYEGKSSATQFQKDFEIDSKDKFEEEWFESVKTTSASL